ncbi:MAG TPA: DUF6350 family protein [Nocardioidaceae bacterium]|nr:DUF6350 family protein [Nocardioidaceae bacterium]
MTDLLGPPGARAQAESPPSRDPAGPAPRAPALTAAVAGLASATAVLLGCMALGLVGWYASDAGSHGSTRDALRVGADGWLLAHGASLQLTTGPAATTLTALPLGLTVLCLWLAHRCGRRAATASAVEDARGLLIAVSVLSGVYGLVALVTAVLASTADARPSLIGSFAGGVLVAALGGGSGLLVGSRSVPGRPDLLRDVPETVRAILTGAVAAVLALAAAASVLLSVALLLDLGSAANVLSRLHAGVSGGLLATVLVAAVAPNAVLLTGSYLLGPGFSVGSGTLVSPGAVVLGPVPAFPLLAALPAEGPQPAWLGALVVAPVAASVVGVVLMLRRHPALGYLQAATRGLGAGVAGGLLVTLLVGLSGGAVGPGRMADVGADLLPTVVSATVGMGVGGLFAGIAVTALAHRALPTRGR